MKWKTEKVGDERILKRFALFPIELNDGMTIWLESYKVKQILTHFTCIDSDWNQWIIIEKFQ